MARWWQAAKQLSGMTPAEAEAAGYAMAVLRRGPRHRAIELLLWRADALMQADRPADALAMYREAARAGDHGAVVTVVNWPGLRGDHAMMEPVYREAIAAGDVRSLAGLATLRARLGDEAEARRLYQQGDDADDPHAVIGYGGLLARTQASSETAEAVAQYRQRAASGDTRAFAVFAAFLLGSPGGKAEAEAVLRRGAELLDNRSRSLLAALLLSRGAVTEAAQLVERLRATGTEYIRAYAEELAREYGMDSVSR